MRFMEILRRQRAVFMCFFGSGELLRHPGGFVILLGDGPHPPFRPFLPQLPAEIEGLGEALDRLEPRTIQRVQPVPVGNEPGNGRRIVLGVVEPLANERRNENRGNACTGPKEIGAIAGVSRLRWSSVIKKSAMLV